MTPELAYDKRFAGVDNGAHTWDVAPQHVKDMWLAAWTIAAAVNREDEREACAKLCDEWARICDSGKRHGAKVGAQECAKMIRTVDDAEHAYPAVEESLTPRRSWLRRNM